MREEGNRDVESDLRTRNQGCLNREGCDRTGAEVWRLMENVPGDVGEEGNGEIHRRGGERYKRRRGREGNERKGNGEGGKGLPADLQTSRL